MTKRKPVTVAEILVEEFMKPIGLTQAALAAAMGVPRKHVNELCNDRRTVTAATALILARVFGNSPDFWLNVQRRHDLVGSNAQPGPAQADRSGQAPERARVNPRSPACLSSTWESACLRLRGAVTPASVIGRNIRLYSAAVSPVSRLNSLRKKAGFS